MRIETIGIVGAGQIGTGIAQVAALSGFEVKLLRLTIRKLTFNVANQLRRPCLGYLMPATPLQVSNAAAVPTTVTGSRAIFSSLTCPRRIPGLPKSHLVHG